MFPAYLPTFYDRTIINKQNLFISIHETNKNNKNKHEKLALFLGDIPGCLFSNACNTAYTHRKRKISVLSRPD